MLTFFILDNLNGVREKLIPPTHPPFAGSDHRKPQQPQHLSLRQLKETNKEGPKLWDLQGLCSWCFHSPALGISHLLARVAACWHKVLKKGKKLSTRQDKDEAGEHRPSWSRAGEAGGLCTRVRLLRTLMALSCENFWGKKNNLEKLGDVSF